jgi:hypothetical protein
LDIHEHDIGVQPLREFERFEPGARLAHHFDFRVGLQDEAETGSHQLLVVDDQHTDRHAGPPSSGSVA